MGLFRGKRKQGLQLAERKKRTYRKPKLCYINKDSPFPKRLKTSPSFKTSTPFKTGSPFKSGTPFSSRKQLFGSFDYDINDITDEFSVLDISDSDEKQVLEAVSVAETCQETSTINGDFEKLIPSVLNELNKAGKADILLKFLSHVSTGKFPLNNIAFQLWCDVVDWYGNADTRQMRYSPDTLQFFWVGKKLFGGRFIRFMSGMKNETQQLSGSSSLDPLLSKVNFACPSENVLADFNPFGDKLPVNFPPGFLEPMIKYKAEREDSNKSFVVMFDGKKVKRGGDVDLLGFEGDKTLKQRLEEKESKEKIVHDSVSLIGDVQRESNSVSDTPDALKPKILSCLISLLMLFSTVIKSLRGLKVRKAIALEKLKKKCNDINWQNTKYAYSIDACRTALWRIQNSVDKALKIIKCICKTGAYLNGSQHLIAKSDTVDLEKQGNVRILKSPEHLSEAPTDSSFIKQRTPQWEMERKKVKVTGSSIYQAIGCDSLKRQRQHYDKVVCNVEPPKPSEEQQTAMQHGIDSEIHQVATMSSIIAPFLYPELVFFEEGFYVQDKVLVSPDGSLQNTDKTTAYYAFEGKAPSANLFCTPVHYQVPQRYISQTLFEQRVLKLRNGTLYMSWSPESCTLFKVTPNEDTCKLILDEIERIYSNDSKRPTRISEPAKHIKTVLKDLSDQCEFLGEFPTVRGFISETLSDEKNNPSPFRLIKESSSPHSEFTYDELMRHLLLGKEVLNDAYELQRSIASQVVVFLLADLDRFWKAEEPHAIPIAYIFRGYSLSMDIVRQINEQCKSLCRKHGLDVIVSAADGEFSNLMVRGNKNNPLTQHQLSKDIWSEVSKMSKTEILDSLKDKTKRHTALIEKEISDETGEERIIRSITNMNLLTIQTPTNGWQPKSQDKSKTETVHEQTRDAYVEQRESMDVDTDPNNNDQEDADDTILYEVGEIFNVSDNKDFMEDLIPVLLTSLQALDKKKWKGITGTSLAANFQSAETLKRFTVKELQEISRIINLRLSEGSAKLKVSGANKTVLINQVSKKLCDCSTLEHVSQKRSAAKIPPLQILANRAIMKKSYPKNVLNIAYCNFIWSDRKKQWLEEAHVHETVAIVGVEGVLSPYYVPDFQKDTEDFEISVYDKTHLGSNLRKAICLDNVEGISKSAWNTVAEIDPNVLNKALIEVSEEGKILDQMKEKIARSLFTEEVETIMSEAGYDNESIFCRIIREGLYDAEDSPGIPAVERCQMRINLINWLDEGVDFGQFPPYGAKIKGLSYVLYEGLRSSNEAKLYLYALSRNGSYCARAPNTLCSESFFSTMQEMDPWGQGVLTITGVKKHISDFTALTAMKMQSDKPFHIRTKKDAAYPVPETYSSGVETSEHSSSSDDSATCDCRQRRYIQCIIPRDHYFDTTDRARRTQKVKPFKFSGINDPARGDQNIRSQFGFRLNEAKVRHSDRIGLKLNTDSSYIGIREIDLQYN